MNSGLLVVNTTMAVLVLVMAWLMPALTQRTLPFGVRVPGKYVSSPVIARNRRSYRRWVAIAGGVVVLVGVALSLELNQIFSVTTLFLVIGVVAPAYVRARRAIQVVKQRENWYEGLRQGISADTSLRTDPERVPWLYAIPAVLVLAATAVLGIIRYPDLPPTLVQHYDANGFADRIVETTVGSAFLLVFLQGGLTALILVLTVLSFRARPDLDAAAPKASARQHRGFARRMAKGLLLLAACVNVTLLVLSWQMWDGGQAGMTYLALVPIVLGVVVLLGFSVRTGQGGSRLPAGAEDEDTGLVHRDDDRNWRGAGMIYVNRDDRSLFVPKRFGVGWTVNFGNPFGVLLILGLVAAALLVPILAS